MPDDQTVDGQVAEQSTETDQVSDLPDQELDETAAFNDEADESEEDENELGLATGDASQKDADEKADDGENADGGEDDSGDDDSEGDEDGEEDTDEDIARGKEIIEAKEKLRAEQEQKAQESQSQQTEQVTPDERRQKEFDRLLNESFDKPVIEAFKASIPKNLLPTEPVTLEDGTELDFGEITKQMPELPIMIQAISHNMVRQMMTAGLVVGGDTLKQQVQQFAGTIDRRLFTRTVTNPAFGVPKAIEIEGSDAFKEWFPKQKQEIQALKKSTDPMDRIRLLKRFENEEILSGAQKDVAEKDKARMERKKKFDSVHKTTMKSVKKKKVNPPKGDTPDAEKEAFESDDDDDLI